MALRYSQGLVLLVAACMFAITHADTIVVGGSENWRFGFNYSDWSLQHGPFYINDTLVFNYDPPNDTTRGHSVYWLPNMYSYITCDLSRATLVANPTQGSGEGFNFTLRQWRVYYFASGEGDGSDCKNGQMKFFALPLPRVFP